MAHPGTLEIGPKARKIEEKMLVSVVFMHKSKVLSDRWIHIAMVFCVEMVWCMWPKKLAEIKMVSTRFSELITQSCFSQLFVTKDTTVHNTLFCKNILGLVSLSC